MYKNWSEITGVLRFSHIIQVILRLISHILADPWKNQKIPDDHQKNMMGLFRNCRLCDWWPYITMVHNYYPQTSSVYTRIHTLKLAARCSQSKVGFHSIVIYSHGCGKLAKYRLLPWDVANSVPVNHSHLKMLSLQEGSYNHTEDLLLDDRSIIQTSMWYISLLELREQSMHSSQVGGKEKEPSGSLIPTGSQGQLRWAQTENAPDQEGEENWPSPAWSAVIQLLCVSHHSTCTSPHSGSKPEGASNSTYKGPERTRRLEPTTGGKTFHRWYRRSKGLYSLLLDQTCSGRAYCLHTTCSWLGGYSFGLGLEHPGTDPACFPRGWRCPYNRHTVTFPRLLFAAAVYTWLAEFLSRHP